MKKPLKHQPEPRREEITRQQRIKSAPGPGGSQESEKVEYHEETSHRPKKQQYDHKPEKDLED